MAVLMPLAFGTKEFAECRQIHNTMRFYALPFLAAFAAAAPQVEKDARDLKSCNNNLAVSVLKLLKATRFCSNYLHISTTQTSTILTTSTLTVPVTVSVTATLTDIRTATSTSTSVVRVTSAVVVDGPSSTSRTTR